MLFSRFSHRSSPMAPSSYDLLTSSLDVSKRLNTLPARFVLIERTLLLSNRSCCISKNLELFNNLEKINLYLSFFSSGWPATESGPGQTDYSFPTNFIAWAESYGFPVFGPQTVWDDVNDGIPKWVQSEVANAKATGVSPSIVCMQSTLSFLRVVEELRFLLFSPQVVWNVGKAGFHDWVQSAGVALVIGYMSSVPSYLPL
jgi:hypothetical protein